MKNSGIEWIGNIPDTWTIVPAGGIFREIRDKNTDLKYKIPFQFKYGEIVRKSNIGNLESTTEETLQTYTCVTPNTLMLNGLNLNYDFVTQRVAIVKEFGAITSAYLAVYPNERAILASFACYLLKGYDGIQVFHSMGSGVRKTFQWKDFKNLRIALPSLSIQSKIVAHLNKKCAQIDALIFNQERQIEKLKQYKQSLITEVVTKGLDLTVPLKDSGIEWIGKIPQGWEIKKAKHIFTQRNERGNSVELQLLSPTQHYGVIPQWLYDKLSGMRAVKLDLSIDLADLKTIHKNDFCISLRSFQGGFEYCIYEGVVSPAYQVFYAKDKINHGYFKFLFKETGFIEKMNSFTMSLRDGKNISFFNFANSYIPVPTLEDQQKISAFLDRKCKQIEKLISHKQSKIEKLNQYKKSLIYEYVTGKKEVE